MKNKQLIIFGDHKMNKQWAAIASNEPSIIFCGNFDELKKYRFTQSSLVYFNTSPREAVKNALLFKLWGFKIIKRWTGTDVLNIAELRGFKKQISLLVLKSFVKAHLSPATWLADELKEFNIYTGIWPTPTPLFYTASEYKGTNCNIPSRPKVLIYSNGGREWLYKTELMLEIAKKQTNMDFVFVGNDLLDLSTIDNAESLGIVSQETMIELYQSCQWLIRITAHDGFPRMVIEALYFGLNVITNYEIPHTFKCNDLQECIEVLQKEHDFNEEGRAYALNKFTPEQWIKTIKECHERIS